MIFDYSFDEYCRNYKNRLSIFRIIFLVLLCITIFIFVFSLLFFTLKHAFVFGGLCFFLTLVPYLYSDSFLGVYNSRLYFYFLIGDKVLVKAKIFLKPKYMDSYFKKILYFIFMNENLLKKEFFTLKSSFIEGLNNKDLKSENLNNRNFLSDEVTDIGKIRCKLIGSVDRVEDMGSYYKVLYNNNLGEILTMDIYKAYSNLDKLVAILNEYK